MTPEQVADRAEKARRLNEDKTLNEAFAAIEKAWSDALFGSAYGASETREHCYHGVIAIRELKSALIKWVQDGSIAVAELKAKGKR